MSAGALTPAGAAAMGTDLTPWGGRWAPLAAAAVLLVALVAALLLTAPAPATRSVPGPVIAADVSDGFTASQVERARSLASDVRPWALLSMVVPVLLAALLGFTPWGAALIDAAARAVGLGGSAWGRLVVGVVVLLAAGRLVALPFEVLARLPRVRIGLSTQGWAAWFADVGRAFLVSVVVVLVLAVVWRLLVLALPRGWWVAAAAAAAAAVVAGSALVPVVVEPLFTKVTPLADGPLRTSLLDLAAEDGVPVRDVLVADASRRTSAANAYVSGLGATKRLVVYDTLVERFPPEQVRSVVAHELGHVRDRDVLVGTLLGALGAAALVCLIAGLLATPGTASRIGVTGAADPRVIAFVLAVVSVATFIATPASNAWSRRIEARADVHALTLTRDPDTFIAMQRELALTNISDPLPPAWVRTLLATHPSAAQRIALARQWAAAQGSDQGMPTGSRR